MSYYAKKFFGQQEGIVTDGLKLWLDASNPASYPGSGTTWYDLSGNGYNGTLVNGPTFDNGNEGSIVFDGVNDYVNSNNQLNGVLFITLSVWIKYSVVGNSPWRGILTKNNFNDFALAVGGLSAPGRGVIYLVNSNNQTSGNVVTTSRLDNGLWNNLTATYDGSFVRLYVNSIQENSVKLTGIMHNTPNTNVLIGAYPGLYQLFLGNISQIQIYNRALTQEEITQNFNATKSKYGL